MKPRLDIILAGLHPKEAEEAPADPNEGWHAAGADVLSAIEAKDAKALGEALRAAAMLGSAGGEDDDD